MQRRRLCARPGCGADAAATLSFQYSSSTAWLDDMGPSREPHTLDICARHAARLAVPNGWTWHDRRTEAVPNAAAANAAAANAAATALGAGHPAGSADLRAQAS